jgi:hypothetical protein
MNCTDNSFDLGDYIKCYFGITYSTKVRISKDILSNKPEHCCSDYSNIKFEYGWFCRSGK